jgi:hypothetical protein
MLLSIVFIVAVIIGLSTVVLLMCDDWLGFLVTLLLIEIIPVTMAVILLIKYWTTE